MALVGASVVVAKVLVAALPVFIIAGLRFGISAGVLIGLVLYQRGRFPFVGRSALWIMFLQAFAGIFLYNVLLLYGLRLTSAVEGGIITSTLPAAVALAAVIMLKERLDRQVGWGVGLAMAGVLVINAFGKGSSTSMASNHLLGNLLVIGAVVAQALFTVFRKMLPTRITPLAETTIITLLGLALFLPFFIFQSIEFGLVRVTGTDWLLLLFYGVGVAVLSTALWFRGVEHAPATTAAVFTGVWPVTTILLSYMVLHEPFYWVHLIGIGFVLSGIVLVAWKRT